MYAESSSSTIKEKSPGLPYLSDGTFAFRTRKGPEGEGCGNQIGGAHVVGMSKKFGNKINPKHIEFRQAIEYDLHAVVNSVRTITQRERFANVLPLLKIRRRIDADGVIREEAADIRGEDAITASFPLDTITVSHAIPGKQHQSVCNPAVIVHSTIPTSNTGHLPPIA